MSPRSGRRPGSEDTKAEILATARRLFAQRGYRETTLRDIGAAAGVDPSLISHYFQCKERLFSVALEVPLVPAEILDLLRNGDPSRAGERVIQFFLRLWEGPPTREPLLAMLRSAVSDDRARELLAGFLGAAVVEPVGTVLEGAERELRATLVGSQLVGLAVARYLLCIEPLASADPERVVTWIAPTLQGYLAG